MKKLIINIIVLILVAAGSFFLGGMTFRFIDAPKGENVLLDEEIHDAEIEELPAAGQRGKLASFFFPATDSEKGIQFALTNKYEEILNVWAVLKTSNGVINVIQAAHVGSSEFLSPIDNTMNRISNLLLWGSIVIKFEKLLLFVSSYIILIIIIPVFIVISVVRILTNNDKRKKIRLIINSFLICLVMFFAMPVSLQLSMFAEEAILSDNVNNLITSIEEKGETAQVMENEITTLRRQGRSVIGHLGNAGSLGNSLIEDIIYYFIIFIFSYIVIPVFAILGFIFLTRYFTKKILLS
jgi:hypothetical protein